MTRLAKLAWIKRAASPGRAGLPFSAQFRAAALISLALSAPTAADQSKPNVSDEQSPIRVGMPTSAALAKLGQPEKRADVGAACGMLDVMSWDAERLRIVAVDGIVTAIERAPSKPLGPSGADTAKQ